MMSSRTPPAVVARWTSRPNPTPDAACDDCAAALHEPRCENCGQLAGRLVGMIATIVDMPTGARIVVARRVAGGWAPVNTVPATEANLRVLTRPGATGPAPTASGGLW
jgi:hypothetical protein